MTKTYTTTEDLQNMGAERGRLVLEAEDRRLSAIHYGGGTSKAPLRAFEKACEAAGLDKDMWEGIRDEA